jgi:hypothetical protein
MPGIPAVVYQNELKNQSANITTQCSISTPTPLGLTQTAGGLYLVVGYLCITTVGSGSMQVEITWTDCRTGGNTAHTTQLLATQADGAAAATTARTATGYYDFCKIIRAADNTTLTLLTTGTAASAFDFAVSVILLGNL